MGCTEVKTYRHDSNLLYCIQHIRMNELYMTCTQEITVRTHCQPSGSSLNGQRCPEQQMKYHYTCIFTCELIANAFCEGTFAREKTGGEERLLGQKNCKDRSIMRDRSRENICELQKCVFTVRCMNKQTDTHGSCCTCLGLAQAHPSWYRETLASVSCDRPIVNSFYLLFSFLVSSSLIALHCTWHY